MVTLLIVLAFPLSGRDARVLAGPAGFLLYLALLEVPLVAVLAAYPELPGEVLAWRAWAPAWLALGLVVGLALWGAQLVLRRRQPPPRGASPVWVGPPGRLGFALLLVPVACIVLAEELVWRAFLPDFLVMTLIGRCEAFAQVVASSPVPAGFLCSAVESGQGSRQGESMFGIFAQFKRWLTKPAKLPAVRRTRLEVETLEDRLAPASFYVTNFDSAGAGSFPQAIQDSNNSTDASSDIYIQGGASGTVSLTAALPQLTKDITIHGSGMNNFTVARSTAAGTPIFRIFDIAAGAHCSLIGMTISNGSAVGLGMLDANDGGGIRNYGSLSLNQVALIGNAAGRNGGAIANENGANLAVADSDLHDNQAMSAGGGVYNDGSAYLSSTRIYWNQSSDSGGGAYNSGNLYFTSAVAVDENSASNFGGGVYNSGTFQMTGGELSGNTAGGDGGGLYTRVGSPTLTNVQITNNKAGVGIQQGSGGGFYVDSGTLNLNGCTISGNTATTKGAGGAFKTPPGYVAMGCTILDVIEPA